METDTQHTPLPWLLQENSSVPNIGIYKDVTEEGAVHPTWECIAFLDDDMERAKANADFIVKCVNSHEALLKAAKKLVRQLDNAASTPYMNIDVNSLREAILKAEGK